MSAPLICAYTLCSSAYALMEITNMEMDIITYFTTGSIEGGMEIFEKALEAGALFLIFECALPKLMQGVTAKFESTKFFEFISKK